MSKIPPAWQFNIDFVGRMRVILITSVIACTASFLSFAVYGLNLGTDFAGGYELQVHFPKAVSESQIRNILAPMALQDARVQSFGDAADHAYLIMVRGGTDVLNAKKRHDIKLVCEKLAGAKGQLQTFSVAESGDNLVVGYDVPVEAASLAAALAELGVKVKKISRNGRTDRAEFVVDLLSLSDDIAAHLSDGLHLGEQNDIIKRMDFVGPQVGAQLRNQGIMAVFYALAIILAYVAFRFDLYFSPGAIVATLHDVIITMGIFSFCQFEFNLTVVAAILTLIGWSLNDTIVVYDRIRENVGRLRGRPLRQLVNDAINETMSRTLLTSGTVFLVVATLLLFGGPHIRGFSITMFIGVIVGTYSSIAVASPIYIMLREWAERRRARPRAPLAV